MSFSPTTPQTGFPGICDDPRITNNGLTATAECNAEDLLATDGNGVEDVFAFTLMREPQPAPPQGPGADGVPAPVAVSVLNDARWLGALIFVMLAMGLFVARKP